MAPSRALRPPLQDLLITNLRLLDLDTLEDWPHITSSIYTAKDGQVLNQRERVTCTEWALYRLFEIWDPDQTRYKLSPFFPPLEPLQSRNLRAALFRMLEDAKRNGTLGRETVLRRTMLDDCKSDKLLEVLVVLSTAIVRRFVAPEVLNGRYHCPAAKLATTPILTVAQMHKLAPVAVAHRASLNTLLRRKAETRARCQTFAQLLEQKSEQLSGRMNACKQQESQVAPPDAALRARVEREVFDNWPGSNSAAWPHTLLYGDETPVGDQPLKRSFQDVWDVVARGGALQPDPDAVGLVESLERRVDDQKERLKKWQDFHDKLLGRVSNSSEMLEPPHQAVGGDSFAFDGHQDIRVGASTQNHDEPTSPISPGGYAELDEIVANLKRSLYEASVSKPGAAPATDRNHATGTKTSIQSSARNGLDRQKIPTLEYNKPPQEGMSPTWTDGQAGKGLINVRQLSLSNIFSPAKQPFSTKSNVEFPEKQNGQPWESENEGHYANFDDYGMGVVAVDSIDNGGIDANYNGSTAHLSLADRTRISLFHANNHQHVAQSPTSPTHALPSKEADSATSLITSTGMSVADRRASLLERTQQSMSNLALAMNSTQGNPLAAAGQSRSAKPRPSSMFQLSVKKQRASLGPKDNNFPVNQFETPGKPRALPVDDRKWKDRNATPTEKLFSDDAEYTSVFKSRPRIKMSPNTSLNGTPVLGEYDIEEEDEDWVASSPLRGKG